MVLTRFATVAAIVTLGFVMAGCGSMSGGEAKYPTGANRSATGDDIYAKPQSIFGEDGLTLLGGKGDQQAADSVITVNSYLWRASLDTVSFMPLASVDPFGGVILTDWYSSPETPEERYKLNVFVLGSQLRADGLKVSVFKERQTSGAWKSMAIDNSMATKIEDTILTRARELRVAKINEKEGS